MSSQLFLSIKPSEKFTQHEELKKLLVSTNGFDLIEHTKNDNFWGDGGDGSGENYLGKLLMDVRSELTGEPTTVHLGQIKFYESHQHYYEFTNFWLAEIVVEDAKYPTSEHYFQSQKFSHMTVAEFIRLSALSGPDVLNFSSQFTGLHVDTVPQTKYESAVFQKFQDPTILKFLKFHGQGKNFVCTSNSELDKQYLGNLLNILNL